jgi:hypothetical protein
VSDTTRRGLLLGAAAAAAAASPVVAAVVGTPEPEPVGESALLAAARAVHADAQTWGRADA